MVKLVKIVDNKYVQIEEYKNPNICFNTNEYSDFEDYCTLRETFDPFEIFYENQELKSQLKGTTHCFDEEEHEILKKQLHEASLTIQEMTEQDIECPSNCDKLRKLKKQLEEVNNFIKKCGFTNIQQVALNYCGLLTQQKEFIKYLEDEISKQKNDIFANALTSEDIDLYIMKIKLQELEEILRKCKEIIGDVKNEN